MLTGGKDDHHRGQEQRNRIGEKDIAVLEEHAAPIGGARLNAEAEEGEPGEIDQGEGEVEHYIGADDRQHVRQDVDEQDTRLGDAEGACGVDIGKRPLLQDRAPHDARIGGGKRTTSTRTAVQYPPPTTPTTTIATSGPGSANMKSTQRMIAESTIPPR